MSAIAEGTSWVNLGPVFWASLFLIGYAYVLYPLWVRYAASWILEPVASDVEDHELPPVTVLIAAYNAGLHLRPRLQNLLDCDYPARKLSILIASDGSTDSTVAQVRELADPRITVLDVPNRRGKSAALCAAIREVRSEVVLFTDVSTHFERAAIRRLARHFRDPDVGIAIGQVNMFDEQGSPAEGLYWRMEAGLRRNETRLGTVLGASGAIYALRKSVFVAPPRPIINDDLVLPMLAQLRHGCRGVFDETAQAHALVSRGLAVEFRRRCRIGAGGYQSLAVLGDLLQPRHWRHAFAFFSHKLLRWVVPFLMIIALLTNLALVGTPVYDVMLAAQLVGYTLAGFGLWMTGDRFGERLPRLAASFCTMNLALMIGCFRWLMGADSVVWNPTVRPAAGFAAVLPNPASLRS